METLQLQIQQQFQQHQLKQLQNQLNQQDQRHSSNLYSKIIFKNNSQEIKDYIVYLDEQLQQQRINGDVEVKLLEILAYYNYELKTIESLQRSIDLYREAFSLLSASPLSYQQVDYAYVLACTARSQYIYDFQNGLKGQIHGGGLYYELDKRSTNMFEGALNILNQLNYNGPYIGMILNMQVSCSLYARSRLWEPDQVLLDTLRNKLNLALSNFKENGYNDHHQDCSESYYLYGTLECHYRSHQSQEEHRRLSQQYFNIALKGFRLHYGQSHPMMAYLYNRMSDSYDMEVRSQNLSNYNSFFKDVYRNNYNSFSSNNSYNDNQNSFNNSNNDNQNIYNSSNSSNNYYQNNINSSSSSISYRNVNNNNNSNNRDSIDFDPYSINNYLNTINNNNNNNDNGNNNNNISNNSINNILDNNSNNNHHHHHHHNHNSNKPILYESIALRYDALTIIKSYYGPNHIETIPIIESIFCTLTKYGLTNPSLQRENQHIQRVNDIPLTLSHKYDTVKCKCSIQ